MRDRRRTEWLRHGLRDYAVMAPARDCPRSDPPRFAAPDGQGCAAKYVHALLANYAGIVQCDGYAAYKSLDAERIALAFCWTHLRPAFYDIAKGGDANSPRKGDG